MKPSTYPQLLHPPYLPSPPCQGLALSNSFTPVASKRPNLNHFLTLIALWWRGRPSFMFLVLKLASSQVSWPGTILPP